MRRTLAKLIDDTSRRLLGQISWASAGQGTAALGVLVETFLFTNALSLADFGKLMLLVASAELIFGLLDCRSGEAVIKFLPELEADSGPSAVSSLLGFILRVDLGIAVLGVGLTLLLFPLLGHWQPELLPYFTLVLILVSGASLKAVVRSCGAYFRVTDQFAFSIKIGILHVALRLLIFILVLQWDPRLPNLCWAIFSADLLFFSLIGGAFLRSVYRRGLDPIRAKSLSSGDRKSVWSFFFFVNLASTLVMMGRKLDVLVIGALAGPSVVALYKVAFRVAGLPLLLSGTLHIAVYPEMSRLLAQGQGPALRGIIYKFSGLMAIAALVCLGGFALTGEWALATVAGAEYIQAFPVVMWMFAGTLCATVFFWVNPFLLIFNRQRHTATAAVIGVIVQFSLLAVLVTPLGAVGGGLAMAAGTITIYLVYFVRVVKDWPATSGEQTA